MTLFIPHSVALTCHPETPSRAAQRIQVRITQPCGGMLAFTFTIDGDLARIRIPPPAAPRRTERLWQHTCCEAFIAWQGGPAYHEFNFSPASAWAAYVFRGYRDGGEPFAQKRDPEITVRYAEDRLELTAVVCLDGLLPPPTGSRLQLGLAAVIEAEDGAISYWALNHPSGKPDFHHPDAFALAFEIPPT